MPRIIALAAGLALSGCGISNFIKEQSALIQRQAAFRKAVEARVVQADPASIRQAIDIAVAEDDYAVVAAVRVGDVNRYYAAPDMPSWAKALSGTLTAAGSTDDYQIDEGCKVDVLTTDAGTRVRTICYEMVEEASTGRGQPETRRVEKPDGYTSLRILEQLDPEARTLWDLEPTGHRTLRCADEQRTGFTLGCPDAQPRPPAATPPG